MIALPPIKTTIIQLNQCLQDPTLFPHRIRCLGMGRYVNCQEGSEITRESCCNMWNDIAMKICNQSCMAGCLSHDEPTHPRWLSCCQKRWFVLACILKYIFCSALLYVKMINDGSIERSPYWLINWSITTIDRSNYHPMQDCMMKTLLYRTDISITDDWMIKLSNIQMITWCIMIIVRTWLHCHDGMSKLSCDLFSTLIYYCGLGQFQISQTNYVHM